MKMLEWSAVD
jgi:hypothetical protein